jgi:hypothetical protein
MRALSFSEGAVLDALRHLNAKFDGGVPTHAVRGRVWDRARVPYDSANRALNGLVALGFAVKVKRGYWRLAEDPSRAR